VFFFKIFFVLFIYLFFELKKNNYATNPNKQQILTNKKLTDVASKNKN